MIKANTLLLAGLNMTSNFTEDGYCIVKNFIDQKTVSEISKYLENKIKRKEWLPENLDENTVWSKYQYYGDPLLELLLEETVYFCEKITGMDLHPTYSYCRAYQSGEILPKHTDRPSCEISVTLNIANTKDSWPFWVKNKKGKTEKIILSVGDAVIYKGCDVLHWREPLQEDSINVQCMLHYVDKNGPYAEYKFDKRSGLGFPCVLPRS